MIIFCLLIILAVVLLASWLAAPLYHKKRMRQRIDRAKRQYAFDEISTNEMRRLLQRFEPSKWITTNEERKFYDALPDDAVLYRGGSLLEQQTEYGSSWSISREVAEFHAFACGKEQRAELFCNSYNALNDCRVSEDEKQRMKKERQTYLNTII